MCEVKTESFTSPFEGAEQIYFFYTVADILDCTYDVTFLHTL